MKMEFAERLPAILHTEAADGALVSVRRHSLRAGQAEVGIWTRAIGHDSTAQLRQKRPQAVIVVAGNGHPIERHPVHEFDEGVLHVGHVAIAVHVLAVDVGDDGKDGRKLEKRAIALVGLGDQVVRLAETRVRAHGIHAPADYDGRIEAARSEHGGDHRSGGGLAVHAGDGDAVLKPHQLGQHFRALDHRNMLLPGSGHLDVIGRDCRAGDHHVRTGDILGTMAFKNGGAQRAQAIRYQRGLQIGTRNPVAEVEQHFGNAAHADAADTDKMHALELGKH